MEVECISLVLGSDLRFPEWQRTVQPPSNVSCLLCWRYTCLFLYLSFPDVYIPILCPREGGGGRGRALALSSDVRFPEWGSAQNPPPPPLLTDIKNKEIFPHILGNSKVIVAQSCMRKDLLLFEEMRKCSLICHII
jgi:hypothetical protein